MRVRFSYPALDMIQKIIKKTERSGKQSQLIILISFLLTFGIVRIVTHLQKLHLIPSQRNDLLHIHHLVPGIMLLLISGYIGIAFWNLKRVRNVMSILFGIGAALTIDEFALWVYLKDVYWEKQGRDSIDVFIIVVIVLTIIFVISQFNEHDFIKTNLKKYFKIKI